MPESSVTITGIRIYLNGYATMGELLIGLTKYFSFYNAERMHQSLANQTPNAVYASATGGGALIVDKFPREGGETPCFAALHREFLQ